MNPTHHQEGQCHILYDAATVGQVTTAMFCNDYWQSRQAIIGQAQGRGTTWFVRGPDGDWVLRHYRRGGMIAPLLGDRYVWTGLQHTRAWREWQLLAEMQAAGLPVPTPVAMQVCHHGLFYRAAILTRRIADSRSLAQCLQQAPLSAEIWQAIGNCIRCFHLAGIDHADLNAHNILLDAQGKVWLIDFDRGRKRARNMAWQHANLQRLQRSLVKLSGQHVINHFDASGWEQLLLGYRQVAEVESAP